MNSKMGNGIEIIFVLSFCKRTIPINETDMEAVITYKKYAIIAGDEKFALLISVVPIVVIVKSVKILFKLIVGLSKIGDNIDKIPAIIF